MSKRFAMVTAARPIALDFGLLVLRTAVGLLMLFGHGWGKLAGFAEKSATFRDPLGFGGEVSLSLAIFAEVFCSFLVVLGATTRLALIPLIVTMGVAALIVHADDPWAKKELAILFLIPFVTLFLTGPGKFSVDGMLNGKSGK